MSSNRLIDVAGTKPDSSETSLAMTLEGEGRTPPSPASSRNSRKRISGIGEPRRFGVSSAVKPAPTRAPRSRLGLAAVRDDEGGDGVLPPPILMPCSGIFNGCLISFWRSSLTELHGIPFSSSRGEIRVRMRFGVAWRIGDGHSG